MNEEANLIKDDYNISLEIFEGPLDLLLYLIKKEEVDIHDIPIEKITVQYLEYLNLMKILDLNIAGDFIVMSSTLMLIKSRMLLPSVDQDDDEEEEEDPRWDLVQQLVEYKKFTKHKSKNSLVGLEIPSKNGRYYPFPIKSEQKKARKYFSLFKHTCFSIGRAGTYRYEVDIDDCISQSLEIYEQIEKGKYNGPIVGKEFK